MVAADLNRDGKLDLVGRLILLGKGNGTFQSGVPSGLGEDFAALAVSDFNGDGKPDVATIIAVGNIPISLALGDFNTDGKPDIVVSQMSGASLLLNTCGSAQSDFAFFQRAEGLILSWPVSSMGFALESATNLTRWLPALEVPTATNGRWTIRVPVNQGERFFRLRQL